MIKHLTPHGNSAALVIDKPIMELLKIKMETPLEITTDGRNIIVSPIQDEGRSKKFKASLSRVVTKHKKTFEKLAK